MELPTKRVKKTHGFQNDDEAQNYLDSLLLGKPELPLEIWVKILSSNPKLSVDDIQSMCRVNSLFKQMCDTGIIWDKIFIRQFGITEFDQAKRELNFDTSMFVVRHPGFHALFRLMTWRIYNMASQYMSYGGGTWYWSIASSEVILQHVHVITNNRYTHFVRLMEPNDFAGTWAVETIMGASVPSAQRVEYPPDDIKRARRMRGEYFQIYIDWKLPFQTRNNAEFTPALERELIYIGLKYGLRSMYGDENIGKRMCNICGNYAKFNCKKCKKVYCSKACAQKN